MQKLSQKISPERQSQKPPQRHRMLGYQLQAKEYLRPAQEEVWLRSLGHSEQERNKAQLQQQQGVLLIRLHPVKPMTGCHVGGLGPSTFDSKGTRIVDSAMLP